VSAHGGLDVGVPELLAEKRSQVVFRPTWQQAGNRRMEIRCEACGYGAVVSRLPARCPMCGRAAWVEAATVEPRSRL
jgi:rubrerythrin